MFQFSVALSSISHQTLMLCVLLCFYIKKICRKQPSDTTYSWQLAACFDRSRSHHNGRVIYKENSDTILRIQLQTNSIAFAL